MNQVTRKFPLRKHDFLDEFLGAQAGEARIRDVVSPAGFSRFRRAAETPFNIVYEARP